MPITEVDKTPKDLELRRAKFCELYASDAEFFGNGVQAYIEAYGIDVNKKGAYASARTGAYRLLTNDDVLKRINELLESAVLNDEFVDKQLAFLITQNAELGVKVKAIGEYNKLRARITQTLSNKDGEVETITSITYMPKQLPDEYWKQNGRTTPDQANNNSQ